MVAVPGRPARALPLRAVALIPGLLSLGLSLSTAGPYVHWQDSGFFLGGIRDLGVLYPPGFVLYLLLAKAWTLLLPFVDFTRAVHLFSSACAALAAAALALAARELLLARGRLFRLDLDLDERTAGVCGIVAGCFAATGYTFWVAAVYAKPYALLYAVLSLLLWRMIRAHESGRPRDFTIVAALIGLAWQAHPSATAAGLSLAGFVAVHARTLGAGGVLWRLGLAALLAAGPGFLLPLLSGRDPATAFGEVRGPGDVLSYLSGSRFVGPSGAFTWEASRVAMGAKYAWEEFLLIPLLFAGAGGVALLRRNRLLLSGVLLWVLPYTIVATAFRIEGQQDHWYVAAWLPLHLAAAAGLALLAKAAGPRAFPVLAGVGLAGLAWAVGANRADIDQREYRLAETMGRFLLEPLKPSALLIVGSDDAASITLHAQRIRGLRTDVLVVRAAHLGDERPGVPGWYDLKLRRADPGLRVPSYGAAAARAAGYPRHLTAAVDFALAQAGSGRPVYLDLPLPPELLDSRSEARPAGGLWRVLPKGGGDADPEAGYSLEPEEVAPLYRRARGIRAPGADGILHAEPYERRLFIFLLRARLHRAASRMQAGDLKGSLALYESIAAVEPETRGQPEVTYPLGTLLLTQGQTDRAEGCFLLTLQAGPEPQIAALSWFYLGAIRRARRDEAGARECFSRALSVPGVPPAVGEQIRRRIENP